jgi:hypothetical protein
MLFLKKMAPECIVTQNSAGEGEVLSYIDARQEKVLECHSDLHPSEKDLPEWRSGMFHKKKYPCMLAR